MCEKWQEIELAPKDGSEIYIEIGGKTRAYWDEELTTWVLSKPYHLEAVKRPRRWLPVATYKRC